ncbi:MAG: hypothetical protein ACOX2X_02185 [Peptococcia bacterium]
MPKIHRLWLFSWSMKPRGKMRKLSLSIFGGMIHGPPLGVGAELPPNSGLQNYVSALPVGDKLKLYYVTSTNERPITQLRVRHIGRDGKTYYFPSNTEMDSSFYTVFDAGRS